MDKRLQENLKETQHNYIAPFLWLHNEDDKYIVAEIERIYECGIRSVCLESRTHEEFCRDDWWQDIELIFKECKRRDMKVWILDDKHFPTGYANGIFEEKYKHLQGWGITEDHVDVCGPVKDGAALASCRLEAEGDEIVGVVAAKHIANTDKYSEVCDITDGLCGDAVYFTLPEGMWRIIFLIKTQRGIAERYRAYGDKMNPVATEKFIEEVYQPHYDRFSQYFGNTFLGFFSDEPSFKNNTRDNRSFVFEMGKAKLDHPWSACVEERMKKLYSDKWRTALAGIWFDISNVSDEARYNFMDIVSDEYRTNFCNKLGEWCRKHGVSYIGHIIEDNNTHCTTKYGPGHYFRSLDGQDMSGIDVVLHQIVPGYTECSNNCYASYDQNNEFFQYYMGKLGSSLAHIDEKKRGRAMCEIFGAYGWAEGTKIMKFLMDHMLVRGINYFVPHAFSPKPNDTDCPPNFYDTGKNPQFKFFKNSMDYMNRMCHMLNDGVHIPACAILYDGESRWINKDFLPLEKVAKKLYDNLFDYDIIPADYLEKIKDGALGGENYKILLVPYSEAIPKEVLKKLEDADIKTVVVSQEKCDTKFENVLLDELCDYMEQNGYRDVKSDYSGIYLRYYHYKRNGAHIYMFSNEDICKTIKARVELSAFGGGRYIEYDVYENKAYIKKSDAPCVELELAPYHSVLIICGEVSFEGATEYEEICIKGERVLKPSFKISVAERNSKEFKKYKTADSLFNINGAKELPHFSGHIKYEAEFETECSGRYLLDLGYVGEVCELFINEKFVGEKLIPPYKFDISDFVEKGTNKLCVVVSNHNGWAERDNFSKFLLFEPSGLLGDIKLSEY